MNERDKECREFLLNILTAGGFLYFLLLVAASA
jgi:hypothetical protein